LAKIKKKITTMKELSEAIGISRPTLSRFFQDPTSVRPATSEKIKERLRDVDYVYNFISTRQNRKSSGLIGVIIPRYSDLFFTSLLEAIELTARHEGYTVITQSSEGDPEGEARAIGKLRSLGLRSSNEALQLARDDFPIVFVDSQPAEPIPNCDFVGTNNHQSISSIVEYLCRIGEEPFFLRMPRLNSNAEDRERAYVEKMQELGFDARFVDAMGASETWEFEAFGYYVMDHHFSRQRHTSDTILCANDRIAIGAIRAANKHGLFNRGGEKRDRLRIAGHDDHPLSQFMYPAVTTVAQDITGIGKDAIRLLLERARGDREDDAVAILKDAALKLRESA
jgi:LacI family repressor for deo operon, udp, cdd, tsx, nupC, and nupG